MSITDYLLMRTPRARMMAGKEAQPGEISGARIALSFLGIILGIVASFYVTGLRPAAESSGLTASQPQQLRTATPTPTPQSPPQPSVTSDFSLRRLLVVGIISLVICGVTYQGLYFSLRLYQNEPALLILFVSFQYGYFWQSVVKGAAAAASS